MTIVKSSLILFFIACSCVVAQERPKRQAYDGNYGGAPAYRQQQGYQQPQAYARPQAAQYSPQQSVQHFPAQPQPVQKPPREHRYKDEEEEKDEGPHPLQLLLENSKFECGGKSDGYYADSGVGCQAFHYCVSGQKHSMMCPAGTVFHQVHLNCVPQDQDICNKADKFFFVNDYLNRPLEQKGPNNTVLYAQRYYPENYAVGDPFVPPQESKREPPAATYGLGPAYREQQPAPVQPQAPAYRPQQPAHAPQVPAYHQNAAPYAPQPTRSQNQAPYTPPSPQIYQPRPAPQYQAPRAPAAPVARPAQQYQNQLYGYGAQQEHNAQAQAAQRAYAQQQHQALAPQQHLYGASAAQRPRYAQQY